MFRYKKIPLFLSRRNVFVVIGLFIGCAVFLLVFILRSSNFIDGQGTADETSKAWEITVTYNRDTKILQLKKLQPIEQQIDFNTRDEYFSPYTLSVIGNNDANLYSSPVFIATEYIFNIYIGTGNESGFSSFSQDASVPVLPTPPAELETVLYAPLLFDSQEIIIKNNEKQVLKIDLPSISGVSQSERIAQSACGALQVVFISDGYTDFQKFHLDVERLKQAFLSSDPYSKKPLMFDFKTLDNSQNLGCTQNLGCIHNTAIPKIARQAFPQASKFIVIADISYSNPAQGAALGIINGIGGNVMAFPRSAYVQGKELVDGIAVHEFLGHGVGFLYDRYVVRNNTQSVKNNCSNNSSGQSFWPAAGITQTYPGCFAEQRFAPAPNNCTTDGHPTLVSGGSRSSVMSAAGCGSTQFDTVEKYWIEHFILPQYSTCTGEVSPTVSPTASTPTTPPTLACDPYDVGISKGKITLQDSLLIRNEVAKLSSTNKGSCLTAPSTNATSIADLVRSRAMSAGLE